MYDFGTVIVYEIMLNFHQNWLLNLMLHGDVLCSVISVNTGTEPKVPIPNFLGTDIFQELIGTDFLRN
jgi:hypothetical protein